MSKGNLLVTNASIVLESEILVGDLRIQDGIIHEISTSTKIEAKEGELVVDGTGLHLMPGMIDPQVHFRDPGQPEKKTYTAEVSLPQAVE